MQPHGGTAKWHGPGELSRHRYGVEQRQGRALDRDGLASDFGFPICVHPHDPNVVFVVPFDPTTHRSPQGPRSAVQSTREDS
jgi:hypothetical protein